MFIHKVIFFTCEVPLFVIYKKKNIDTGKE